MNNQNYNNMNSQNNFINNQNNNNQNNNVNIQNNNMTNNLNNSNRNNANLGSPNKKINKIILHIRNNINENEDIILVNNLHSKVKCSVSTLNKKKINDNAIVNDTEENYTKKIKLPKGDFRVSIEFDKMLTSCKNMFLNCNKIRRINLSLMDTKNVTNMSHMFDG